MDRNRPKSIRPRQVKWSAALLFASAGLRVVDWIVRAGPRHALLDNVVWVGLTAFTVLLGLVLLRRKSWARWFLLVIMLVGLFSLPELFQRALARSTFSTVYLAAQSLLQIGAAVLLFSRPSNDWFRGENVAV